MTIPQAIKLATTILQKAQILIDEQIPDGAVKLWNIGEENKSLICGLDPASAEYTRHKISGRPRPAVPPKSV